LAILFGRLSEVIARSKSGMALPYAIPIT